MKKKYLNQGIVILNFYLFGDVIHAYPWFDLVNSSTAQRIDIREVHNHSI